MEESVRTAAAVAGLAISLAACVPTDSEPGRISTEVSFPELTPAPAEFCSAYADWAQSSLAGDPTAKASQSPDVGDSDVAALQTLRAQLPSDAPKSVARAIDAAREVTQLASRSGTLSRAESDTLANSLVIINAYGQAACP